MTPNRNPESVTGRQQTASAARDEQRASVSLARPKKGASPLKTKLSPAIVGAFVIGACALGIIGLLSFGGMNFLSKPQRFVVDFDESIHGLDLGSPVKLRGVRVGRVVDLGVRFDETRRRAIATVVCEFNRGIVNDSQGDPLDLSSRAALEALVERGLRAQLGVIGLATGLLYVELDFYNTAEGADLAVNLAPSPPSGDPRARQTKRPVAVPALRSTISELQTSVSDILANLREVDLGALSGELRALIVSVRSQVDTLDLATLSAEWAEAGAALNALVSSPDAAQLFVSLDETLGDLRRFLDRLDAQLETSAEGLDATLAEAHSALEGFGAASRAAETFLTAPSGLGEEATEALRRLSAAASAVERLADMLEENPRSLIFGKKKKKAAPPPAKP